MLVPASLLDDIVESAGAVVAVTVAHAIGTAWGRRVAARFGGAAEVRAASIDVVVSHFGGELALAGAGAARLERWGRALVVVVEGSPVRSDASIAALVEGALATATGRAVACTSIAREGSAVRILVASASAVERARSWLANGASWGDVLAKLSSRGEA